MTQPPASVLLVHGAGSGPWIYRDWGDAFENIPITAVDLQEGLDVARSSMNDYAERVSDAGKQMKQPVAIVGWSMGGLVAMYVAHQLRLHSLALIEPSPPAETQGFHPHVELTDGAFNAEEVYGKFPADILSRPESSLARAERKRGMSVPALPRRTLIIYGDDFRVERGEALVDFYNVEGRFFVGLGHWDLVLNPKVREAVSSFIGVNT